MSNIVMLHLTSSGEYGTSNKLSSSNQPSNKPIKSSHIDNLGTIIIGSSCGALLIIGIILWFGIWYVRNQRGTFKSKNQNTIEVNLVNETTSDSSPPSTIQRESETLKRHLMNPVIEPQHPHGVIVPSGPLTPNGTPVYWSASQLLDNNNLTLNRGVNATLDPISEENLSEEPYPEKDPVDEEVYARGLANYGLQTQQQMRTLHNQLHEPIYVGYSPDNSSIYGTASRRPSGGFLGGSDQGSFKKVPPKVPPKPSINALLGIGIVVPPNQVPPSGGEIMSNSQINSPSNTRHSSTTDLYGTAKATRHISHV